jgi:hypothetical protein
LREDIGIITEIKPICEQLCKIAVEGVYKALLGESEVID